MKFAAGMFWFLLINISLSVDVFAVSVDNGDIPTMYKCCVGHVVGYWSNNKREVACENASASNSDIMSWSPKAFNSPKISSWSPDFAGIKVKSNGDIVIRFVLDTNDVATLSQTFNNSDTRIPYALEVEAVDAFQSFGTAKKHTDYDVFYSASMSEAVVKRDLGAMLGFTSDAKKQFEAIIYRPDLLQADVVHEITFHPHNNPSGQVRLHMNFQLTVNYKYIQAMKVNSSDKCDFLDGIIYDAYQGRNSLYDGWAKDLNVGNHGNYLPSNAQSGWYYYAVGNTDASNKLVASNVFEASQIVGMCWDDPDHKTSSVDVCGNLFDLNPGDSIIQSSNSNNDTCVSNQDGGMTCTIGNHTHIIHPDYRCSKELPNGKILCWENGGDTNCWDAYKWYEFNGNIDEVSNHHNDSNWTTTRERSMCEEVYNDEFGIGGFYIPPPADYSNPGGATEVPQPGESDHAGYVHNVSMDDVEASVSGHSDYHHSLTFYHGEVPTLDVRARIRWKLRINN